MNDPRFNFSQNDDQDFSRFSKINHSCCSNKFIDQEFVQFRTNFHTQSAAENDESGVCSPPLWKSSPNPLQSPSSELLLSHHRSLSPASRVQAIIRGQKELMEMVRSMPESSYELSLKDLVEHHRIDVEPPPPPSPLGDRDSQQKGAARVKRQESKRSEKNMVRNGSFEMEGKGLFLKIVLPFSFQSKKRRISDRSFSGRVSLKAEPVAAKGGGGEGEWWRKKLRGSSGSDSSRITKSGGGSRSSSTGSSSGRSYGSGRKKEVILIGCWPFFRSKNGKSEE